ncbi:uncharacterized protein LOC122722473, partial [Manihot esculenta]|uniref:uncharacterized protein LOC122722473 n=1 Tax=Manihot esculenta TaxID=3983 RepID=UPI001CC42A3B
LEWKWENIAMDFVVGLPAASNRLDSIWVIVDRLTKSAHFIPVRSGYSVDKLAQVYVDEIVRLHGVPVSIVSDRGPYAFLTNQNGLYIRKKGKLSPRFIRPYEIVEHVGPVAYRLALPPELDRIHNVFHISMLRRYRSDPSHVISAETIDVQADLTYEEEPVKILAREMKELRNKKIPLVKVLWRNHKAEEATWESEEVMKQQYPQLFKASKISRTKFSKRRRVVTSSNP